MSKDHTKNARRYGKYLLLVLVILAALAAGISLGKQKADNADTAQSGVVLDPSAEPIPHTDAEESAAEGIRIPGYVTIQADASDQQAMVDLMNPEGNPCYFEYEISYADSGDLIYQSGLIQPGMCINGFPLQHVPEEGDYPITIAIHTYSLKDGTTPMNGAEVRASLHVVP